jgi:hypothetical protein
MDAFNRSMQFSRFHAIESGEALQDCHRTTGPSGI